MTFITFYRNGLKNITFMPQAPQLHAIHTFFCASSLILDVISDLVGQPTDCTPLLVDLS